MFLAWFALSDVVLAVCFYSRPEVADSKDSSGHSACAKWYPQMPSFNSLMIYCACSAVTHLRSGWPYPRL